MFGSHRKPPSHHQAGDNLRQPGRNHIQGTILRTGTNDHDSAYQTLPETRAEQDSAQGRSSADPPELGTEEQLVPRSNLHSTAIHHHKGSIVRRCPE